jgi:hypothetical protein
MKPQNLGKPRFKDLRYETAPFGPGEGIGFDPGATSGVAIASNGKLLVGSGGMLDCLSLAYCYEQTPALIESTFRPLVCIDRSGFAAGALYAGGCQPVHRATPAQWRKLAGFRRTKDGAAEDGLRLLAHYFGEEKAKWLGVDAGQALGMLYVVLGKRVPWLEIGVSK